MQIEQRVEALEREARRWKRLSAAALALAAFALLVGPLRAGSETIEAGGFVVRDASGLVRATLGTKGGGAGVGLSLYDAQGNHVVGLSFVDGAALELIHPTGAITRLGALSVGGGLSVTDPAGRRRLLAGVNAKGVPSVDLLDEAGNRVAHR